MSFHLVYLGFGTQWQYSLVVKAENVFLISSMMVIFPLTFLSSAFVNLETIGFTIKANVKGKKRVAHTGIKGKKWEKLKEQAKMHIQRMKDSPTIQNAIRYNSFVLGIHNYFNRATDVNPKFSRLAYEIKAFLYNRLRPVGKYGYPVDPSSTYKKFYSTRPKTFKIAKECGGC